MSLPQLPIDEVLPALLDALAAHDAVVLQAPPGAGKTTRVPLALLAVPWLGERKILMLEPRRIAARNAALFMARLLGEPVGQTVGFRTRLESRTSAATRIEVVTEGILTRMLQSDPALESVGVILFDEFHERSLQADLGLALARESQQALREDLKLLVMSATLDGARIAALLDDAPVVQSAGRGYPVEIHYLPPGREPWERHLAAQLPVLLRREPGSMLVFLPGTAEIRRLARALEGTLPADVLLAPLYGDLSGPAQDAAIAPAPDGRRKLVLATAIAETSLTIDGVRVVVDAGYARRPRFDPGSAMTRLVTERVSRAAAAQRAGRAGRTAPGVCYRLWSESESLAEFAPAEIISTDLSDLVLELAAWGCRDPATLCWLDPPPVAAFEQARALLVRFGALDEAGAITAHGKALLTPGLPVRLAHMLVIGRARGQGRLAAELAALLSERDLLGARHGADVAARLQYLRGERPATRIDPGSLARLRQLVTRLGGAGQGTAADIGRLLAVAFPERVALRRQGGVPRYLMRNGRGAWLDDDDALAGEPCLAIAELDGQQREARIFLAAPLDKSALAEDFGNEIEAADRLDWDEREEAVIARRERRLGALLLESRPLSTVSGGAPVAALCIGIRKRGLAAFPWQPAERQWQARVIQLRGLPGQDDLPDVSDAALLASLEQWAAPWLEGITRLRQLERFPLREALASLLDYSQQQRLNAQMPTAIQVPSGRAVALDYCADNGPVLAVKLQEMFGMTATPAIAGGALPLMVHLLSPAGRPVAVTRDLASFWQQGYPQVRKDLRGRYPKHPWPENPLDAAPTRSVKRRS